MGVPLYFKNIIHNYPEIVLPVKKSIVVDNLFFDLNCAIHPCCANKINEEEMYEDIFLKIKECVELTKVKKFIYIAIDGPAPRTKMEQQRQRRLKSYHEKKVWDTNQITPGTLFMNHLSTFLQQRCRELTIPYFISDSNEIGEGEHKIMNYIKTLHLEDINVVYGLDADLIMLSLIKEQNIYLLRERTEYNIENIDSQYIYFDMQTFKKSLLETIQKDYLQINNETILNDYLFICFFIGNDFIIPSPSINIRYNGLDILLETYNTIQKDFGGTFYLMNQMKKIDMTHFLIFLKYLSEREENNIHHILKIRRNQSKKYQKQYSSKDYTIIEDFIDMEIEESNERLKNYKNHSPIILRKDEEKIFRSSNNYYLYHFYDTFTYNPSFKEILKRDIYNLCIEYLRSIQWTTEYYFHECIHWKWYYPYHFAPLLNDLYKIASQLSDIDLFMECEKKAYTPEEQLKIVLPLQGDSYFYPEKAKLYTIFKRYFWECHLVLPH
tara:strand:+ start:420 stop:1904 length:1485 start_codon:yes stop_codon:yes gene_type:complete